MSTDGEKENMCQKSTLSLYVQHQVLSAFLLSADLTFISDFVVSCRTRMSCFLSAHLRAPVKVSIHFPHSFTRSRLSV